MRQAVTTARRFRTVQIKIGDQTVTAADPLTDDLAETLAAIRGAH